MFDTHAELKDNLYSSDQTRNSQIIISNFLTLRCHLSVSLPSNFMKGRDMNNQEKSLDALNDTELVALADQRDPAAIRLIMSRHNQRLFRAAWSVLRNNADAEDAIQDAYLKIFANLSSFKGAATLSTWMTRIAVNTALDKRRASERWRTDLISQDIAMLDEYREKFTGASNRTPEELLIRSQLSRILKAAIAALSDEYRSVYVLRDVEGMSIRETSSVLELSEDTVKTRLSRARAKLREELMTDIEPLFRETLPFAGSDCERLTDRVLDALRITSSN